MRLIVLVVILMAIQVPAALELANEVRLQLKCPLLIHPVALVSHLQLPVVTDGLNDCGQELVAGGHILEEDPILHAGALIKERVKAEGIQHPGADTCSVHIFLVDDAVSIVPAVTDNLNSENVEDCFYMICERTRREVASQFIYRTPSP